MLGVIGFNLFTLFIFVTAPVDWQTDNVLEVVVFVLFCQVLVVIGFGLGRQTGAAAPSGQRPPFFDGHTLVPILFGIYVMTLPISYAYRMELAPFDIPQILSRLQAGIEDPHLGYAATLAKTNRGSIPWSVFFAISIFNQLFFAAGFVYWRQLKVAAKVFFAGLLGIELFYWVGTATSFGVVVMATTWGLSTMFWGAPGGRGRKAAGHFVLLSLLLVGTIAFFSYNLYRRSNFTEVDVQRFEYLQALRAPLVLDHPVFAVVPQRLWPTYVMVVSYLAQGYYHTCFAFDLDFRSTGLLGNNTALISLGNAFGISVWNDSYMHRLQRQGIDEYGAWHSAYTWYASDVSFFGVPVVLFVLGYLFGFSWAQGLRGDFLSRVVFIMFGNMLLFLFANNTYLASVFYAFMVFVPLWIFTRFCGVAPRGTVSRPAMFDTPVPDSVRG